MSAGEYNPNWWAQAQQCHGIETQGVSDNLRINEAIKNQSLYFGPGREVCGVPGCYVCARAK